MARSPRRTTRREPPMTLGDKLLADLLAASQWGRAEQLERIAGLYGDGFANTMRAAAEAELKRRADQERKRQKQGAQ